MSAALEVRIANLEEAIDGVRRQAEATRKKVYRDGEICLPGEVMESLGKPGSPEALVAQLQKQGPPAGRFSSGTWRTGDPV